MCAVSSAECGAVEENIRERWCSSEPADVGVLGTEDGAGEELKDYGIQGGWTVYLVMRGSGGMQTPDTHISVPTPITSGMEGGALGEADPTLMDPPLLSLTAPTPEISLVSAPEMVELLLVINVPEGVVNGNANEPMGLPEREGVGRHPLSSPEASGSTTPRDENEGLGYNLMNPGPWMAFMHLNTQKHKRG